MKICIPTATDHGKESILFDHFGSAHYFIIYNQDSEELEIVSNQKEHHEHGQCNPVSIVKAHDLDAVIYHGMGKRAIMALKNAGIKVYLSRSLTTEECIQELKENILSPITPGESCPGHGHQH